MPKLTKESKKLLDGPTLTLENVDLYTARLAQKDKRLLRPPTGLKQSCLYDIFYILQRRSDGQQLFNELIRSYFQEDRLNRVSFHLLAVTKNVVSLFINLSIVYVIQSLHPLIR